MTGECDVECGLLAQSDHWRPLRAVKHRVPMQAAQAAGMFDSEIQRRTF